MVPECCAMSACKNRSMRLWSYESLKFEALGLKRLIVCCSETGERWRGALLQPPRQWGAGPAQPPWELPGHRRREMVCTKVDPCQVLREFPGPGRGDWRLHWQEWALRAMGCSGRMREEPGVHGRHRGVAWSVPEELQCLWFIGCFTLLSKFSIAITFWNYTWCVHN